MAAMPASAEEEQAPLALDARDLRAEDRAPAPEGTAPGSRAFVALPLAGLLLLAGAVLCWPRAPASGAHDAAVARPPKDLAGLYNLDAASSGAVLPSQLRSHPSPAQQEVVAVQPQLSTQSGVQTGLTTDLGQTTPAPDDIPVLAEQLQPSPQPSARPALRKRRGSFLVIGDWGYDEGLHGNVADTTCQKEIGSKMLAKMEELGDVKFIINVGDSFYPEGLKSKDDPQWDTKWRNMYDPKLRSVPWYSVYGNHDYHHDPCGCSSDPNDCAQVNYNISNLDYFYMPGYNWYKEHPELNLEVIGLDMNKFMGGWNGSARIEDLEFEDCQWSSCKADCYGNSNARAEQGFELFAKRFEESTAKNLLVFSHYPTDYFQAVPEFLKNLSIADDHHITYFGGHRHNTDQKSTWQTHPNTNWLVGGGGGWSCDGQEQGFVVGEIDYDYKVTTKAVLVDVNICCPPAQATA